MESMPRPFTLTFAVNSKSAAAILREKVREGKHISFFVMLVHDLEFYSPIASVLLCDSEKEAHRFRQLAKLEDSN
jgi:hypothetical protein